MHKYTLLFLATVLPIGAIAACSSSNTSSRGQEITCTIDPNTGVIGACAPGDGSGSGSGVCHDIDEDGDGDPHDVADNDSGSGEHVAAPDDGSGGDHEGDSDGDGIPDDQDCDNRPGEDNDPHDQLPYDVLPALGSTTRPIQDAFAEKGSAQPAEIVSVSMQGDTWRLAEIQAGTAFLVTQDDCNHAGNRDVGRDRVIVTWRDVVGGATQSDHLDIRYCKN
jgi:hypothetical protein